MGKYDSRSKGRFKVGDVGAPPRLSYIPVVRSVVLDEDAWRDMPQDPEGEPYRNQPAHDEAWADDAGDIDLPIPDLDGDDEERTVFDPPPEPEDLPQSIAVVMPRFDGSPAWRPSAASIQSPSLAARSLAGTGRGSMVPGPPGRELGAQYRSLSPEPIPGSGDSAPVAPAGLREPDPQQYGVHPTFREPGTQRHSLHPAFREPGSQRHSLHPAPREQDSPRHSLHPTFREPGAQRHSLQPTFREQGSQRHGPVPSHFPGPNTSRQSLAPARPGFPAPASRSILPPRPGTASNDDPRWPFAKALLEAGRKMEALAKLQEICLTQPDHEPMRLLLLELCIELRREYELQDHADWVVARHTQQGRVSDACDVYRRIRSAFPELSWSERALSGVMVAADKCRDASLVADATKLLAHGYPDSAYLPRALLAMAEYQRSHQRPDLSRKTLSYLIDRFPMDALADMARRKLRELGGG